MYEGAIEFIILIEVAISVDDDDDEHDDGDDYDGDVNDHDDHDDQDYGDDHDDHDDDGDDDDDDDIDDNFIYLLIDGRYEAVNMTEYCHNASLPRKDGKMNIDDSISSLS
jgi:hypothetical protein